MPDRNAPGFSNLALSAGQKLAEGRFTLARKLGQGGMGVVWLARDERLGLEVALKFLPAEIYNDPASLEDLRREALKSRGLSHPNIIRIHDFHEHAGEPPFISMEYVEGSTLHALRGQQEHRVFTWEFIQPLVRQLCEALDYAHSEKVIHRDLKPANVMLDKRGRVKLADFGIAAAASDSMSRVSLRGNTSGTPGYMSPQQMDGRAPRVSDDVYSLGAMIYELLTSKAPFHRGDIAYQARHLPPDPMGDRLAEFGLTNTIPPDVAALVMACLAKEPEQRPASVRAVADWLGMSPASNPPIKTQEAPTSLEEPISPLPNQRRWLWPAVAAGVVVAAIVAGALFLRKKDGDYLTKTSGNSKESTTSSAGEFVSLFNGQDLTGWAGIPKYWSVKDGAIVGKSDMSTPNTGNTFLIWQGGQVSDFEFLCKYKLVANNTNKAANSGIQFRAFMVEFAKFTLAGYQAELDPGTLRLKSQPDIATVNGAFITDGKDDRPGKFWINVGQKVVIQPATVDRAPVTVTGSLGQAQDFADAYKPDDWNEVKIVAVGKHIQIFINGRQTVDAIDNNNLYTSGLLGLQLNAPQLFKTVYFKDIKLRVLKSDALPTLAAKDGASTFALARQPSIPFAGTLPGTIWLASDSDGEKYCFQFAPNGVLTYESQRGIQPSGKWQQDGQAISIDINNGFTLFSGTISGNKMQGKALSKNGKNWSWEATPQN